MASIAKNYLSKTVNFSLVTSQVAFDVEFESTDVTNNISFPLLVMNYKKIFWGPFTDL